MRRAFLCGLDPYTGKDYNHRRDWMVDVQRQFAGLFGVEICFHAELSNHLHLILRARPDVVDHWNDREIARRFHLVNHLVRSKDGSLPEEPSKNEIAVLIADPEHIVWMRRQLASISRYMGALGEHIARRANREDKTSGAFWESRFKCRNLESEREILVCGIYVDLNQIRSGEVLTPEDSTYTSVGDRIRARRQRLREHLDAQAVADGWLCELTINERQLTDFKENVEGRASNKGLLPLTLDDYLTLLDWSGRQVQAGKSGAIPSKFPPILERLGMSSHIWTELATKIERWFIPIAKPAGCQAAGVPCNSQPGKARYHEARG